MESIFSLYFIIIIVVLIILYLIYRPYWIIQSKIKPIDENTLLNNVL